MRYRYLIKYEHDKGNGCVEISSAREINDYNCMIGIKAMVAITNPNVREITFDCTTRWAKEEADEHRDKINLGGRNGSKFERGIEPPINK